MRKNIKVLMTRVDGAAQKSVTRLLQDESIEIHHVPWDDNTLFLVQKTAFDIILVGYPVAAGALRRFLKCVRVSGSACHRAGLILLTNNDEAAAAQSFIGHGVNRSIADRDIETLLPRAVEQLTGAAPRLTMRTPTRIVIQLEEHPVRAFCQTENLSLTGMLLRGFRHYPPGTTIDFEINIPGESDPIRGAGKIARTTNAAAERVEGIAAHFLSFEGSDQSRLESYLSEKLH